MTSCSVLRAVHRYGIYSPAANPFVPTTFTMSSIAGETAVTGKDLPYDQESTFPKGRGSHGVREEHRPGVRKDFIAETSYLLEKDRPFLIIIDQDGLISALQKLDAQLRAVRPLRLHFYILLLIAPRSRPTGLLFCLRRFPPIGSAGK